MGHKTVAQRRQAPLSDEEGGGGGSGTAGRGPTLVREQREGAGAAGPCSALALHLPWLGPLLPLRFRAVLIEVHSIKGCCILKSQTGKRFSLLRTHHWVMSAPSGPAHITPSLLLHYCDLSQDRRGPL